MSASDFVLAIRLIRKQPVLTLTAVLALATGIGLAVTGFTFLEAGLRAELPFSGGDRFVMVDAYEEPLARRAGITTERFHFFRKAVPALRHLGALQGASQNLLLRSGDIALVPGVAITPDSFAVLPYAPLRGRTLTARDGVPGAASVVLIRESLWQRHFSGDPGIVGRRVSLDGVPREIVGVMPDTLEFPNSPEVWLPLTDTSSARLFGVLGAPDDLALVRQQLSAASEQFDDAHAGVAKVRLHVLPFIEAQSQGLDILATSVVFVLVLVLVVIAANVANLVLARTLARSSELAVRSAMGATRARLVAQVFIEVLVLGVLAAILGVFASRQALDWVERTMTDMPFWVNLDAGPGTAAFVAAVTVLAAAVGGAWPALRATRGDTMQALAASNRRVASGLGPTGSLMIALQIALSIAALYAALVVARGVSGYMQGVGTPREEQIITARVTFPGDAALRDSVLRALDVVRALPGVQSAGLATSLPRLSPPTRRIAVRRDAFTRAAEARSAPVVAISPEFVETLGAEVTTGRAIDDSDLHANAPPVAVVNEPFVAKFFGGVNPVGQQLQLLDADSGDGLAVWHEIVGVVPDLGLSVGDERLAGGVYIPIREEPLFYLAASVDGDANAIGRLLPRTLASTDPQIQVREVQRLPDVGREDRAVFAGLGAALTSLGVIALALSVIGVYAMLSFAVTSRTREIAIRSALGATRAQVLRNVLGRAALPLAIGVIAGPALGTALVAARGIFAFRLPADAEPWAIPTLTVIVAAAAVTASFMPARRALRVNTSDALRGE